jgi:hypothetical protein
LGQRRQCRRDRQRACKQGIPCHYQISVSLAIMVARVHSPPNCDSVLFQNIGVYFAKIGQNRRCRGRQGSSSGTM